MIIGSDKDSSPGIPLAAIVESLGTALLRTPSAAGALVRGVRFPESDIGEEAGGMLLAIPAFALLSDASASLLVASAQRSDAAGIVVRAGTPIDPAVRETLPLLELAGHITWSEFDAMVTQALGETITSDVTRGSNPEGLFAIVDGLAATFGGSVVLEDHRRGILAYSTVPGQRIDALRAEGILGRRPPEDAANDQRYAQVLAAPGIVRFPGADGNLPRAAIAVRSGALPLGTIWVIDPEHEEEHPTGDSAVVEAADRAAGLLLESWRAEASTTHHREAAVLGALREGSTSDLARLLGIRPSAQCIVVAAEVSAIAPHQVTVGEAVHGIRRRLDVAHAGTTTVFDAGRLVAVVPTADIDAVRRTLSVIERDVSTRWGDGSLFAISDPFPIDEPLTVARTAAVRILDVARPSDGAVLTREDVRASLILADGIAAAKSHRDDAFDQLLGGGERARAIAFTTLVWLEERGQVTRVAERLGLHEQSVRYRLRRFDELLPGRLADADETLALWITLRAHFATGLTSGHDAASGDS